MTLIVSGLDAHYGPVAALRNINLVVEPGQVISVIGPNGAGKTTLLAAMTGLVSAKGSVKLDGTDLSTLKTHLRARAGLGYVPGGRGVFSTLTVREHIVACSTGQDKAVWERLIGWFPILNEKRDMLGTELSGGQQQMLSIARAMASNPRYILLDEPSIGLSPIAIGQVAEAIQILRQKGVGILLAEQNAGLAMSISDRCLLLVRGETQLEGSPEELREKPEVEALYLGRPIE